MSAALFRKMAGERERERDERGERERDRYEETAGKHVNATFHNVTRRVMELSAATCSMDNGCTLQ